MNKSGVESVHHRGRQSLKSTRARVFDEAFVINIPRSLFSKTAVITSTLINGAFNQVCHTVVHSVTLNKHIHTEAWHLFGLFLT